MNQRVVGQETKSNNQSPAFNFRLVHPKGRLASLVQGIWVASVPSHESRPVVKQLYSGACSSIAFNLGNPVSIGDEVFPAGVIVLPVEKQAEVIQLPPGSLFVGVRFFPAIGYAVLDRHYNKPALLEPDDDQYTRFDALFETLRGQADDVHYPDILMQWSEQQLSRVADVPCSVRQALTYLSQMKAPGALAAHLPISQRQIERLFKEWLEMTPKQYQRILRTGKAVHFLREHEHIDLAAVAMHFGFSDQAHMTREFRRIARTTPGQIEGISRGTGKCYGIDKRYISHT